MLSNRTAKLIIFFLISTGLLGLDSHVLNALRHLGDLSYKTSASFQIMGRLVKSRQDGICSGGGLLGYVGPVPEGTTMPQYQTDAYYEELPFDSYDTYNSQIGFQGITYSLFDKLTSLPPAVTIKVLWLTNSTLFAMVISAIILWFYLEFGLISAVVVLITTMYSQWMTKWGNGIMFVLWSFYVPFAVSLFVLRYRKSLSFQLIAIFLAIFVKCLYSGYNLMTTTLIMTVSPYIYYSISEGWRLKEFLKKMFAASSAALISVLTSILILIYQVSTVKGNISEGFDHILYSLLKRSHGNSANHGGILAESLNVSIYDVIQKYFKGTIIDLNNLFETSSGFLSISYEKVIIIFLLVSFLIFQIEIFRRLHTIRNISVNTKKFKALCLTIWFSLWAPLSWYILFKAHAFKKVIIIFLIVSFLIFLIGMFRRKTTFRSISVNTRKMAALCLTTWFSLCAPLSWYILFKAHAYLHITENYLAWHMPFTLFGFALAGMFGNYLIVEIFSVHLRAKTE